MAFLEKAEKQDLILLAEELGQKVSDKLTVIDLKNIIVGSKDFEKEFVKAYLSVIAEERVERKKEETIARQHTNEQETIARQHAIEQQREQREFELEMLRLESVLHKLRLETGSIRSNVRRASYAGDLKKTSSNDRISIVRGTSPAVLMTTTKPVSTTIKEEKGYSCQG
ncbi:hypothetical protein TNIN_422501 [Trichonephila inaurata madagascariensis]|uniref:Uncharacterized protein n=1 Tax=Trichonephila inaurata madagascariensis TaxID=2747483 RepID=A0A8X6Y0G6_9ARAC|nr:hypothetical protein TNIN_422501 [Trichonephila inaurata madagascariensis]